VWQLVPPAKLTSAPGGVDDIETFCVFESDPGKPGIAEHPASAVPSAANTINLLMGPPVDELHPDTLALATPTPARAAGHALNAKRVS